VCACVCDPEGLPVRLGRRADRKRGRKMLWEIREGRRSRASNNSLSRSVIPGWFPARGRPVKYCRFYFVPERCEISILPVRPIFLRLLFFFFRCSRVRRPRPNACYVTFYVLLRRFSVNNYDACVVVIGPLCLSVLFCAQNPSRCFHQFWSIHRIAHEQNKHL